jgi:hypothetical protein
MRRGLVAVSAGLTLLTACGGIGQSATGHSARSASSHTVVATTPSAARSTAEPSLATAFLVTPNRDVADTIHDRGAVITLPRGGAPEYLPVAKVDRRYLLLRAGADSWREIVVVSPGGHLRVLAHAERIPADVTVRHHQIVYVTEPAVGTGRSRGTVWRRNWVTGRLLGKIHSSMPRDAHATGGFDDISVEAIVPHGVWMQPGLFWSGRTGQRPYHRAGFVGVADVGLELTFHRADCWSYRNPVTDKRLWRRCGAHVDHGFGVSPDGSLVVANSADGRTTALRNVRTGTVVNMPSRIGFGAWESNRQFVGEASRTGDVTRLMQCSARTGTCQPIGPHYGQVDLFTRTGPGFT